MKSKLDSCLPFDCKKNVELLGQKCSTKDLKEQVLSPNEPSVNIERIARLARSEKRKKLFQIFSRQGASEIQVASVARWEEHLRMLIVLQRECLELKEEI